MPKGRAGGGLAQLFRKRRRKKVLGNDADHEDDALNSKWYGVPIEEIDPFLYEDSFCVISRKNDRNYVYRFSCSSSLFLFGPLNDFRLFAIRVITHRWFDYLIILTIFSNCITLALTTNEFERQHDGIYLRIKGAHEDLANNIEYGFLGIYTLEMILKIIGKGFLFNKYSYLRNKWNILDFVVVTSAYLTILISHMETNSAAEDEASSGNELEVLRVFRVLRIVKTISILPGLKTMINALLESAKQLIEVMALTFFCLMIFALFALEVYKGQLQQKCVKNIDPEQLNLSEYTHVVERDYYWARWVNNPHHWQRRTFPRNEPVFCGNNSYARGCDEGYTCLPNRGQNPQENWLSFDTFQSSMLSTFQVITLDYWERSYDVVVSTSGAWSLVYFFGAVFFGSYCLLNLILAVVSLSYDTEASKDIEMKGKVPKMSLVRTLSNFSIEDVTRLNIKEMTYYRKRTPSERELIIRKLRQHHENQNKDGKDDLGATVLSLLGRKLTLGDEILQLKDSIGSDDDLKRNKLLISQSLEDLSREVESYDFEDEAENDVHHTHPKPRAPGIFVAWYTNVAHSLSIYLQPLVNNILFEAFITICIVCNTILLAMEHHDMKPALKDFLDKGNLIFMAIYTFEAIFKLFALQLDYFKSNWNIFDITIIGSSYIDFLLQTYYNSETVNFIRGFRLLRVFKLGQSWITMKILLNIIYTTLAALGNLTLVLFIVIYMFAVLGMQVVGHNYKPDHFEEEFPKWHFRNFWFSFMMIFRVLCGEWIEPMWECLQASRYDGYWKCFIIFPPALLVGNFIVLNLFLALLLNSFSTEELESQREKALEATGRTDNLKAIVGLLVHRESEKSNMRVSTGSGHLGADDRKSVDLPPTPVNVPKSRSMKSKGSISIGEFSKSRVIFQSAVKKVIMRNRIDVAEQAIERASDYITRKENNSAFYYKPMDEHRRGSLYGLRSETPPSMTDSEKLDSPGDCIPPVCWNAECFCCYQIRSVNCSAWNKFRQFTVRIVGHPKFETFILFAIITSSITLAFEDKFASPAKLRILSYINEFFGLVFLIEMLLKFSAMGIYNYVTNVWTILDGLIVITSLVNSAAELGAFRAQLGSLKALRTLRALRPLRAISRWQGMKIVVNALLYAIPAIFNVLLVCCLFWLLFSIMGVQLFHGKFYRCVDDSGALVPHTLVANKSECCAKVKSHNYTWINWEPNFDNVLEGYLALFQLATYEGWMELMELGTDITDVDLQARRDAGVLNFIFFTIFIVLGGFFILNLFVGVIIDNFNNLKKKYEGNLMEVLLTPAQRRYFTAVKKLAKRKPRQVISRPKNEFIAAFYDISMSRKFEISIFALIFINMIVLSFDYNDETQVLQDALGGLNAFFTFLYVSEAAIKIVGLRFYYFSVPWNVFDFILVLAGLLDMFVPQVSVEFPIPPTMLRILRTFRIGRVLRLIKSAKGLRKLLHALLASTPALFNIAALLFLVTFIYAILGMALFKDVAYNVAIDSVFNFQTFFRSCLVLFRLMTAAGWNEILDGLNHTKPVCGLYEYVVCSDKEGTCPRRALGVFYCVTYLLFTYLIILNMYMAVILENFVEANNEEESGVVPDDFEMFYIRWSRFDPYATQYINFSQLSDFLATLDPPFMHPKPNVVAIVSFNLPIYRGDKVHCLDVLHAVVLYVLGQVEDSDEFRKLQEQMELDYLRQFPSRKALEVVSSTRVWKIQQNAAIIIQRAWRHHRLHKNPSVGKKGSQWFIVSKEKGGFATLLHHIGEFAQPVYEMEPSRVKTHEILQGEGDTHTHKS